LLEGTRVYGVVTCCFANRPRPTIIACEIEEIFRIQQRVTEQKVSLRRVAHLFIPKSHLARAVSQVHDHVELHVKRNCDH